MKLKNLLLSLFLVIFIGGVQATSLTDTYENLVVDHLFRGQTLSESTPASFYVALFTTSCTDSALGTEVSGGSYARVGISRALTGWNGTDGAATASAGTGGIISNAAVVQFAAPTASWGSVTSFAVMDASTAGNAVVCSDLTTPKTVNNGDAAPSFAIGALTVQIDN